MQSAGDCECDWLLASSWILTCELCSHPDALHQRSLPWHQKERAKPLKRARAMRRLVPEKARLHLAACWERLVDTEKVLELRSMSISAGWRTLIG